MCTSWLALMARRKGTSATGTAPATRRNGSTPGATHSWVLVMVSPVSLEQDDLHPVDPAHAAQLGQSCVHPVVDLARGQVDERRGDPHQPTLLDQAMAQLLFDSRADVGQPQRGHDGQWSHRTHRVDGHPQPLPVRGSDRAGDRDRRMPRHPVPTVHQAQQLAQVVRMHVVGDGGADQRRRVVAGQAGQRRRWRRGWCPPRRGTRWLRRRRAAAARGAPRSAGAASTRCRRVPPRPRTAQPRRWDSPRAARPHRRSPPTG